jgi:hypothetical protein
MNNYFLNKKWIRYTCLFSLLLFGVALGYMRWTYVIIWDQGPKFIIRHTLYAKHQYPNNWSTLLQSFAHDPRWMSLLFYSITSFLLSLSSIYVYYLRKDFTKDTAIVYGLAWTLVIVLSLNSLIFPSYAVGLGLAQNLKNLLQTPLQLSKTSQKK